MRVVLADDHHLVRAGLRSLLERIEGVEVVGEARDAEEVLRLARSEHPDLVLLDIAMPGLNGIEAAARLRVEAPGVRVVILSMHAGPAYVSEALKAGAAGYLLKDSAPVELELAVRAVAAGQTYLSPAVSSHLVSEYRRSAESEAETPSLTPRQREILQAIAEGLSNKEIARRLGISIKTVQSHRQELMGRLDLHDTASLVRYAIREGLVTEG